MGRRIIIPGSRDTDIFRDHGLPFSLELERQDILKHLELDADEPQDGSESDGILDQISFDVRRQLFDRKRAELHAVGRCSGLDLVAVVKYPRAALHQFQMAIHRVLIERHQNVELVAEAQDRLVAGPEGQKDMAAADDGLIGVVGVEVKSAPDEDGGQDISRRRDSLPGGAADADGKIDFAHG